MKNRFIISLCLLYIFSFGVKGQSSYIDQYEYWYDDDFANRSSLSVSGQPTNYHLLSTLNINGLSVGQHKITWRMKDNQNFWSVAYSRFLYKFTYNFTPPITSTYNITHYEYWFDNDFANRSIHAVGNPALSFEWADSIDISTLSEGHHTFNVRMIDAVGSYTVAYARNLYKYTYNFTPTANLNNKITSYRYWIDDKFNQAVAVNIATPVKNYEWLENLPMDTLSRATHSFTSQFKDSLGLWSVAKEDTFFCTNAPCIISATNNSSYCSGTNITVNFTVNCNYTIGTNNVFTAQLSDASGSFANPLIIGSLQSNTGGSITGLIPFNMPTGLGYRVRVIGSEPFAFGSDNGTNLTINNANFNPSIVANRTAICVGGSATLTNNVVGITGTYTRQWQISTDSVTFSNISAATGATYALPTTLTANSYFYRLQISKSGVNCPAFSDILKITVKPDPTVSITGGGASFCGAGGGVLLSSICSPPLGTATYTWQRGTNGTTFANIAGANSSSYTTPTVSVKTYYRLVYGNSGVGCTAGTSNSQVITINPFPTVTVNPTAYSMCVGGTKNLTASGATTYSWSPSTNLNTTTGATVSANPIETTVYTVTGTNSTTGCSKSVSTTLTVVPLQSLLISTASTDVCSGSNVAFTSTVSGGAGTCTFFWQSSVNGTNWVTIANTNTSTYTAMNVTATSPRYYRLARSCTGSNCGTSYSNVLQLIVSPIPTLSLTGPSTVCSGGTPTLTATLSGGAGTCALVWQRSLDNGVTWTNLSGAVGNTYTASASSQNIAYRVTTTCTGTGCGTVISNIFTVTVVPDPTISVTGAATFCGSGTANLNATISNGTGTCVPQWQEYVNSAWTDIVGAIGYNYTPLVTASRSYRAYITCSGNGCNVAYSSSVAIAINPLPNVAVNPTSFDMCVGGTRNLVASGASAYSWTPATALNATTGATVTATPTTTITYYVTGTNTTTGCTKTVSTTINVAADPIATISGNGVCPNGASSLTANIAGGTGTYTYLWQSSPNGTTWTNAGTTNPNPTANLSANTYYKVKVTSSNTSCDVNTSVPFLVSIFPQPTLSLAGNATICAGGTGILTATLTGGTGVCAIVWQSSTDNVNWTTINGASGLNYTTPTLSTNTYYRASTSCTGGNCQAVTSGSVLIQVVPVTSVAVNGAGAYCGTPTVNLSAVQTGGAGVCSFQWQEYISNAWTNIQGATNSNFTTPTLTSAKDYRLYVSCTGNGCAIAYSPTASITLKPLPTVTVSPTSFAFCVGASKSLGAAGANTYTWTPATGLSATTGSVVTANPTITQAYTVTGTNTTTGCSNTASTTITVAADPIASVTGLNGVCLNGATTLHSNITGGMGTYTYIWQSGTNGTTWTNISGATNTTYNITGFTANTYYRVKVTSSITSCDPNYSPAFLVSVAPQPSISLSGGGTFAANASVTLSSSATGGVNPCTRKWQSSPSGNSGTWTNISGVTTSTHNFNAASTSYYRVIYNCVSSCDSAISNTVLVTVTPPSRMKESLSSDISLYPNPASSEVTLSCLAMPKGKIIVKLVDVIGREMGNWEYDLDEKGYWETLYNLTNYATGIYTFHIFSDGKEQTIKFVKE